MQGARERNYRDSHWNYCGVLEDKKTVSFEDKVITSMENSLGFIFIYRIRVLLDLYV